VEDRDIFAEEKRVKKEEQKLLKTPAERFLEQEDLLKIEKNEVIEGC